MKINKIFPLFYLLYSKKEKRTLASKYILPFFNYRKKGNNNFENNNFLSGNSIHERSKIQKYSNIFEEKEERMIRTFPYSNPLTTSPKAAYNIEHATKRQETSSFPLLLDSACPPRNKIPARRRHQKE